MEDGQARLPVSEAQLKGARLILGPELPPNRRDTKPTLALLSSLQSYEPVWRFERDRRIYELLPIPESLWRWWNWCRCRVRGRVVKRTTSNGVTMEQPVCNARVHICEVDRLIWVLPRLPDDIIWRLRDELLKAVLRPPIPWPPEPGPWEGLDPGVIDPPRKAARLRNVAAAMQVVGQWDPNKVALNPQPEPPSEISLAHDALGLVALNPQPEPPSEPSWTNLAPTAGLVQLNPQPEVPAPRPNLVLPLATRAALMSNALPAVRQALLNSVEILRPWLCAWDWLWPWFHRCDEMAVVTTDEQGRFDTEVWYPCFGDHPDLYFWVEASIGGTWETVYHPSIGCNTYWDYACGSEVTIRITDPRVPGCGDKPEVFGKKVVVKSIARQVSMSEINREPSLLNPLADPAKAGTVQAGWLYPTKESPFGAILEPRVDFGNGLKPAGITHYRWSYRPLGSTDEGDWQVIEALVSRHYRETTPPGDPVVYKWVQIGPAAGVLGYYVEIEPSLPAGGEEWEVLDEGYDLASTYWDTRLLAPGKYELKLELFRLVGGVPQRVDLDAEGVELYQMTDPAPFTGGTLHTALATHDRVLTDSGTGHKVAFRLVLHVDNRVAFGTIDSVIVAPGANDTKCGFLEYAPGASATIAFRASHPANYAYFDFDVARVATPLPSASAAGLVGAATVNGFTRAGNIFTKPILVTTLFNEGLPPDEEPCVRAAFGEHLHVYALATDGYHRLNNLDAPRAEDPAQVNLRAFALTPEE